MSLVWISESVMRELCTEADRAYPLETGGVLAGYVADNGEPVVRAVVGPGPEAVHNRHRFTPDHAWQCRQLDILFAESSGASTYVGDWHTHPDGLPQMSWLDRRTLRSIARHRDAGVARPLMLIGGGSIGEWDWVGHRYRGARLFGLLSESDEVETRTF